MKKTLKIIMWASIIATLFLILFIPSTVDATSVSSKVGSVKTDTGTATENISDLEGVVSTILGFLQVLSAIMAVVVIAFTGFSYIAAETVDLKRELKERMLPIVIGVVLVFGAVSITNFILGVTSS